MSKKNTTTTTTATRRGDDSDTDTDSSFVNVDSNSDSSSDWERVDFGEDEKEEAEEQEDEDEDLYDDLADGLLSNNDLNELRDLLRTDNEQAAKRTNNNANNINNTNNANNITTNFCKTDEMLAIVLQAEFDKITGCTAQPKPKEAIIEIKKEKVGTSKKEEKKKWVSEVEKAEEAKKKEEEQRVGQLISKQEQYKTLSPEDPLNLLGVEDGDRMLLERNHGVLTIRQLANYSSTYIPQSILEMMKVAQSVVHFHESIKTHITDEDSAPLWGYHYMGESVWHQIQEDREIKSPQVLFDEYLNCPLSTRAFHPWKKVFNSYLSDAAKWNGGKGKKSINSLTDADVYAFLVWRSADTFAKYDITAGPRAIYFTWNPMPSLIRSDCIAMDKVIGEDLRDTSISDRYTHEVAINVRMLVKKYGGKLFRVGLTEDHATDTNHWNSTTLDQGRELARSTSLWDYFEAGNSFFGCVPHGCIEFIDRDPFTLKDLPSVIESR